MSKRLERMPTDDGLYRVLSGGWAPVRHQWVRRHTCSITDQTAAGQPGRRFRGSPRSCPTRCRPNVPPLPLQRLSVHHGSDSEQPSATDFLDRYFIGRIRFGQLESTGQLVGMIENLLDGTGHIDGNPGRVRAETDPGGREGSHGWCGARDRHAWVLADSGLENELTERDEVPTAEYLTPRQAVYRR